MPAAHGVAVGAVGIAASGAGAYSDNSITDDIEASIADGSVVTTTGSDGVSISALDESIISSGRGVRLFPVAAGGVGRRLGFGISIAENDIGTQGDDNIVKAFIDNSQVNTSTGSGTITITAESTASIKSFSLGAAVSIAISDPDAGLAGRRQAGRPRRPTIFTTTSRRISRTPAKSSRAAP